MKRLFFCVLIFSLSLIGMDVEQAPAKLQPKILILMSAGGRGHISAAEALREYLGKHSEVKIRNLLKEILGLGWYEDLYNKLLTLQWRSFIGPVVGFGQSISLPLQNEKAAKLIEAEMIEQKPDLVISVVPLFNVVTTQVLQRLNIPYWIIPTDFDASLFVQDLRLIKNEGCYVNVPLMKAPMIDIVNNNISKFVIKTDIGMPVRTQFLQKYDVVTIKKNEGLPLHKKIVMVMLGGRGSIDMPLIAQQLAKVKNVHCIFSIPKRPEQQEDESVEALEKRIAEWESDYYKPLKKVFDDNAMLSATILQFRSDIAQFMACADLLITKSGGQTVSEALYLQIPMILDVRDKALPWEELNRALVINNNLGTKVTNINDYASVVQKIIDNPAQLAVWKQNMQKLQLPNPEQGALQMVKSILKAYHRLE